MFKRKVKVVGIWAAVAASVIMGGCSFGAADYSHIEGYAQVEKAQKLYSELDSGHFYMQDNATGKKTGEFTFKYREDGHLMYMYMASDESGLYSEFHNGSEINRKEGEGGKWSFIAQGDENYFFYSRDNKHPYACEGVISMNAFAITDSSVEKEGEGEKISFKYDPAALAGAFEGMGTLKSFESTIWLNDEGYCRRLDQKGVFDKDGGEIAYDYSMFIDMMNEVEKVERVDTDA